MPDLAHVAIHRSQFPDAVRRDLLESLRTRRVNHKFHYDSVKQTQQWLALHQAFSPSRTDADCAATYDRGFAEAVKHIKSSSVHLVGLGCGGGQKDTRLLRMLRDSGKELTYTPSDVSAAMVLVARVAALGVIPSERCYPLVCDLASAGDLPNALEEARQALSNSNRLITFFGMIPNFEPQLILPRLASVVRISDLLLFSANLAPGPDYLAGVEKILPLYDNTLTHRWLMTFLLDLGIQADDGDLKFVIEKDPDGGELLRVAACFEFSRARKINVEEEAFEFASCERIRLFFSYRHTPNLIRNLLAQHGLKILDEWITKSEEEGVFLCSKT